MTTILFTASGEDPAAIAVWSAGPDGLQRLSPADGVHSAHQAAGTRLLISRGLADAAASVRVLRKDSTVAASSTDVRP